MLGKDRRVIDPLPIFPFGSMLHAEVRDTSDSVSFFSQKSRTGFATLQSPRGVLGLRHLLPVQLAIQEKCAKLVQKHFRDL